jgi:hypothetical protein
LFSSDAEILTQGTFGSWKSEFQCA